MEATKRYSTADWYMLEDKKGSSSVTIKFERGAQALDRNTEHLRGVKWSLEAEFGKQKWRRGHLHWSWGRMCSERLDWAENQIPCKTKDSLPVSPNESECYEEDLFDRMEENMLPELAGLVVYTNKEVQHRDRMRSGCGTECCFNIRSVVGRYWNSWAITERY